MNNPKIITRDAYVRSSSLESVDKECRTFEFVISSEAVDSYGTVFKMDGWDLRGYEKNPVVCYQHRSSSPDPDDVIGTSELFIEDNKLMARVTFEDAETNAKAEKVRKKVLNGTLKMASVGARVLDYRFGVEEKNENKETIYFTKTELVEWSVVAVGANPDALKRNQQTLEEIKSEFKKEPEVEINGFDLKKVLNRQLKQAKQKESKKRSVIEAQLIINKNL